MLPVRYRDAPEHFHHDLRSMRPCLHAYWSLPYPFVPANVPFWVLILPGGALEAFLYTVRDLSKNVCLNGRGTSCLFDRPEASSISC